MSSLDLVGHWALGTCTERSRSIGHGKAIFSCLFVRLFRD